ncbi:11001_t:CDS:2 [Diversispora eburnea]|uniref:11001_t:CDS:1 n=1 Tax=Diversispora eburnea TaxID=1213867 RepID=A0A9N8WAV1_9GLOM|nr:11001_t:CDS:2 [Diversispora eburnea]
MNSSPPIIRTKSKISLEYKKYRVKRNELYCIRQKHRQHNTNKNFNTKKKFNSLILKNTKTFCEIRPNLNLVEESDSGESTINEQQYIKYLDNSKRRKRKRLMNDMYSQHSEGSNASVVVVNIEGDDFHSSELRILNELRKKWEKIQQTRAKNNQSSLTLYSRSIGGKTIPHSGNKDETDKNDELKSDDSSFDVKESDSLNSFNIDYNDSKCYSKSSESQDSTDDDLEEVNFSQDGNSECISEDEEEILLESTSLNSAFPIREKSTTINFSPYVTGFHTGGKESSALKQYNKSIDDLPETDNNFNNQINKDNINDDEDWETIEETVILTSESWEEPDELYTEDEEEIILLTSEGWRNNSEESMESIDLVKI